MATESLDVTALTEELTIQQVILDSLRYEHFDNIEEERQEARREIERLKSLLEKAKDKSEGRPRPDTNGRATPSRSAAMADPRRSHDIWSTPGSASIPSRKRTFGAMNLHVPSSANKSRRTSPTPNRNSFDYTSQAVFDSDPIDIIDLTGDDIEADSALVAQQMRELERQTQENNDRDMAFRLSNQGHASPPPANPTPHHNAFSKLMASQRSNSAGTPGQAGLSTLPSQSSPGMTGPQPSQASSAFVVPGAYNNAWDDPFQSRPAHGSNASSMHQTYAQSFGMSQQTTPGFSNGVPPYSNSNSGSITPSMPGSFPDHTNGTWAPPYQQSGFSMSSNPPGAPGFMKASSQMPWSGPAPGPPPPGGKPSLMDLITKTSMFDYSGGMDASGQPLPERLTSYIQEAFHDPRISEKELDDLLQNIRPDMEISEKNRDGTPAGLKNKLYPHQELALTWMKKMEDGTNKGGILADDMGLGKTISTLALMLDRPAPGRLKTNLIIGPLSLVRQWEEEISKRTKLSHRLSVFVYHNKKTTTDELLKYDVVLTTYGTIAQELKRLEKYFEENSGRNIDPHDKTFAVKCPLLHPGKASFYRIILDEAQCIKNKETQTAKACHKLRATYRWCLTGTPMMNGVLELYSLIHFLRIKPYCEWERFRNAFGVLFGRKGDAKSVAMSRLRALLKAVMLRRKKDSQLDGKPILRLPEKSEEVVYAQLSEEERDFYDQLEKKSQVQFSKYLREGTVGRNYSNILVLLLRLRQACCHPHLNLDVDDANNVVDENMLDIVRALDETIVKRIRAIEAFECPICQDAVQCPSFFVPCGHDSCKQCLVRIVDDAAATNLREGNESDRAKCPMCRGLFDPKKCFTYDAFQKIHMPEAVKEEEATEEGDSESDSEDSDEVYGSDDEVDDKGNLKDFIVDDEFGTEQKNSGSGRSKKQSIKKKGKKKQEDVKPSMLKTLRKEANKNRDAFKRYMRYLRKTWMPAAKVSQCMDLLKTIQATGEKTIIFSQWTLLLDLLEVAMWHDKLPKPERYDGSMSAEERNTAAHNFRDRQNVKVMLVSLRAGNAGLNLTAASRVIIMDPFWNPYIEMQAVDRAYRIGQQKPVKVYRILTQETVEDRIVALQERKKNMVEAALDETESMKIGRLNVNELKFLFNTRD
ncbi:ATP-dependent helicase [Paramyrothecium foliicola]|nr:ATP-dependent helicase [Paramyrothecium foliicola]